MQPSVRKFGVFSSSEDPQKLADTVKGFILQFGVVVIWLAHYFGVNIGNEGITVFAIGAGQAAAALWILYGLLKKFFMWVLAQYAIWKAQRAAQPDGEV